MPVYIEEMTSDLAVFEGDQPLTSEQLDKLVETVLSRLSETQREAKLIGEATGIRREASPPAMTED